MFNSAVNSSAQLKCSTRLLNSTGHLSRGLFSGGTTRGSRDGMRGDPWVAAAAKRVQIWDRSSSERCLLPSFADRAVLEIHDDAEQNQTTTSRAKWAREAA